MKPYMPIYQIDFPTLQAHKDRLPPSYDFYDNLTLSLYNCCRIRIYIQKQKLYYRLFP